MLTDMNRRLFKPKFKTSNDWFNRIIGTGKIDIKPSGYVDIWPVTRDRISKIPHYRKGQEEMAVLIST